MEDNGFYVTLPSNASLDIYPNNKISSYTTKFSRPIELRGAWEVGLAEIQYPHTWNTIALDSNTFYSHVTGRGDLLVIRTHKISTGYYKSIDTLLDEMNKNADPRLVGAEFSYSSLKNKIFCVCESGLKITVPGKLANILGLVADKPITALQAVAPYPADIRAGFYTMYVYTDIIDYQRVGDSFVPLLRTVHIEGENNDIVTISYEKPHYVPVNKKHIDDITIELKTDQNQNIKFRYGKAIVKLHFRPVKHHYHE